MSGGTSWENPRTPHRSAGRPQRSTNSGAWLRARRLAEATAKLESPSAEPFAPPDVLAEARKLQRLTRPDEKQKEAPGLPEEQLRAAQKSAHDLAKLLASARARTPEQAERLANVHAIARKLDLLLAQLTETGAAQTSRRATRPQGSEIRHSRVRVIRGPGAPVRTGRRSDAANAALDALRPRPTDSGWSGTYASVTSGRHPGKFELVQPSATGDRLVGRVTPRPHPVTLQVASPSHGQIRVGGLARFFPAHTVHTQQSTAVVAGDHCKLESTDHYHVRRVQVSLDPLLPGSRGYAALQDLLKNPTGSGVARFQRAMRRLSGSPKNGETRANLPVQVGHFTSVTSSTGVQQGDRCRTSAKTHYMVEESKLPVIDLLAHDRALVRSLVAAAKGPGRGPATRTFLRDVLRAADRKDDLALLDHANGLRGPTTSIFGLFGVDVVKRASAVMVGTGNRMRTATRVHRGCLSPGTVLNDLSRISNQQSRARDPQVTAAQLATYSSPRSRALEAVVRTRSTSPRGIGRASGRAARGIGSAIG